MLKQRGIEGDVSRVRAVLLAGGFGTRLRPLTCTRPKPMLPVLDRPLLAWNIELLHKQLGVREVDVIACFLHERICAYFRDEWRGVRINYHIEESAAGDAGSLRHLMPTDETLVVMYGDVLLLNADLQKLVSFHEEREALVTMLLTPVKNLQRYGVAEVDEEGRIRRFVEKPAKPEEAPSNLVNAGVYVFSPQMLRWVPPKRSRIAEELIPRAVREGRAYGMVHRGGWWDIGVLEDYLRAMRALLEALYPDGFIHRDAVVEECEFQPPIFIGSGVEIRNSSLHAHSVVVGSGGSDQPRPTIIDSSLVANSIVFPGARIHTARIRNSLVGEGVVIGRWSVINNSVLADFVTVREGITVANSHICPFKEVASDTYDTMLR